MTEVRLLAESCIELRRTLIATRSTLLRAGVVRLPAMRRYDFPASSLWDVKDFVWRCIPFVRLLG